MYVWMRFLSVSHVAQVVQCDYKQNKYSGKRVEYLHSMCSDCVEEAGDTPRDDEDDEVPSRPPSRLPAAMAWDRATDGERFPWRLWSIRSTTWVTLGPTEQVL